MKTIKLAVLLVALAVLTTSRAEAYYRLLTCPLYVTWKDANGCWIRCEITSSYFIGDEQVCEYDDEGCTVTFCQSG